MEVEGESRLRLALVAYLSFRTPGTSVRGAVALRLAFRTAWCCR